MVNNRCQEKLSQFKNIDCSIHQQYDELFNTLVDYCWVMCSMQYCINIKETVVRLLITHKEIKENTAKLLVNIYNSAIGYYNESVFVSEALAAINCNNLRDYPFRYKESLKYVMDDYSTYSLEHIYKFQRDRSKNRLALFYGLSATNIRADEMRRGFYDPVK